MPSEHLFKKIYCDLCTSGHFWPLYSIFISKFTISVLVLIVNILIKIIAILVRFENKNN